MAKPNHRRESIRRAAKPHAKPRTTKQRARTRMKDPTIINEERLTQMGQALVLADMRRRDLVGDWTVL